MVQFVVVPIGATHLQATIARDRGRFQIPVTDDIAEVMAASPMLLSKSSILLHWICSGEVVP